MALVQTAMDGDDEYGYEFTEEDFHILDEIELAAMEVRFSNILVLSA